MVSRRLLCSWGTVSAAACRCRALHLDKRCAASLEAVPSVTGARRCQPGGCAQRPCLQVHLLLHQLTAKCCCVAVADARIVRL